MIKTLLDFLNQTIKNTKLGTIVTEKRKREVGLAVAAKYVVLTKNKTFANTLLKKLREKKKKSIQILDLILLLLL